MNVPLAVLPGIVNVPLAVLQVDDSYETGQENAVRGDHEFSGDDGSTQGEEGQ